MAKKKKQFKYVQADSPKTITINFDKVFDEDIEFINSFDVSKKKTYWNKKTETKKEIIDSMNFIFERDEDHELLLSYLHIKCQIDTLKEEYAFEDFMDDIFDNLLVAQLYNIISHDYLEGYTLDIDKKKTSNNKYKESLQFTNKHAKLLLKISMCVKFLTPLAAHYLYKVGRVPRTDFSSDSTEKFLETDEYLFIVFKQAFDLFELYKFDEDGNKIEKKRKQDMAYKITDSIRSRISATKYSDKIMWDKYTNLGVSPETILETFLWKTVTEVFPRFVVDKNVFTLMHVCWKNFLNNLFRTNFVINFKPIDLKHEDADGLNQFDKIDLVTARINESKIVTNERSIKMCIDRLQQKYEIKISQKRLNFYKEHFYINKIQKELLSLFYASHLGNSKAIYHCNKEELIKLSYILSVILKREKFKCLNKIILSTVDDTLNEKKALNKKHLTKLLMTERYQRLLDEKYSCMKDMIEVIISKLIANLISNHFNYMNFKKQELVPLEFDNELISQEVLRFIEML